MIRCGIVASLLLSPMLLAAQTKSAGDPLRASLETPHGASVTGSRTDDSVAVHATNVSTGVVAPKLASVLAVEYEDAHVVPIIHDRTFTVSMTVDPKGLPQDVKVVDSSYGLMNRSVVDAVSRAHFTPGTVNNQPTAVPMTLEVVVVGTNR